MEVLPGQDRLDQLDLALLRSKVEGRVPSGIDSVHRREVGPAHDGYRDVTQVVVDRTVQGLGSRCRVLIGGQEEQFSTHAFDSDCSTLTARRPRAQIIKP